MIDKMRSEFEEWWKAERVAMNPPAYVKESAWITWQACAATMVPEGYVRVPVELLDRFPELNEFNYSHDDVCELNAWGIDLVLSTAPEGKK